ncbi:MULTISPECIES: DUF948 domain-containing protein [Moorena]|uniref:DUF948 domain-containing protein n=1 Tax=Moorena producens 3L TaxID=489825 RepID=F4XIE2_9CYAN|nr:MULTISPECIES: DUF948 domain-containing protein [Moorena]NEQ18117.1 DUF948 domain-containing protein [Moorena sp. SIO3E2]NES82972.1 DUF948 domain-containing protein [Moorena sp. SIO2B7]EGJ35675.1 hypothetical protein LYNGBM3L_01810 [Moorena producens 3L]NEP35130.1 DUF948 domain-containing protein [Moorena sp. SIO3B2]NEP66655.1 DUF948 domain-containing protein [Moorena sp. SIO3A5]
MIDPLFWLGLSFLLVAVSLTAVLVTLLPAVQELARAARSVEKLADTLNRELPPTLEAIRLTGLEISDLTDDLNQGVQSAGHVVQQVDHSISSAKNQAQKVKENTRNVVKGVKAAWKTWRGTSPKSSRSIDSLPSSHRKALEIPETDQRSSDVNQPRLGDSNYNHKEVNHGTRETSGNEIHDNSIDDNSF